MQISDFDLYTSTILQQFRQRTGCTFKFNDTFQGCEVIVLMPAGPNMRFIGSRWSECAFKMNGPVKRSILNPRVGCSDEKRAIHNQI